MKLPLKNLGVVCALVLGLTIAAPSGNAQSGAADDAAAKERAARDLVVEALPASRVPEIYQDLRRTLREVYLPAMRDAAYGNVPGLPAPDPKMAEAVAKLMTLLTYALKASDELEPVLAAERDAMVSDAGVLLAKHSKLTEIDNLREMLRMTAARKSFDTVYAASRLVTGFNHDETRSMQEFSAWASQAAARATNGAMQQPEGGTPSPEKVAKAQALVNDLLRVSRIEDMAADAIRFAREVVLPVAPGTEEERADLKAQIDQYEFNYNMQKGMMVAAAPALIAQFATDEQLGKLHDFVRSPACAKTFQLLYDVVRAATAFTVPDLKTVIEFGEKANASGDLNPRTPEQEAAAEADWEALRQKWSDKLMASLSPETRDGLERSIKALEAMDTAKAPNATPEKPL